jgi:hypothetical protein
MISIAQSFELERTDRAASGYCIIRPGSELATAAALRNSLPDFLAHQRNGSLFKKFLRERIETPNFAPLRFAG